MCLKEKMNYANNFEVFFFKKNTIKICPPNTSHPTLCLFHNIFVIRRICFSSVQYRAISGVKSDCFACKTGEKAQRFYGCGHFFCYFRVIFFRFRLSSSAASFHSTYGNIGGRFITYPLPIPISFDSPLEFRFQTFFFLPA